MCVWRKTHRFPAVWPLGDSSCVLSVSFFLKNVLRCWQCVCVCWSLQVLEKYVSGGMCGFDKEGSPIWYDIIGPLDPKGLMMSASKQDFMRTKVRDAEILRRVCEQQSAKVHRHIPKHTHVTGPCLKLLESIKSCESSFSYQAKSVG